MRGGPIIAIDGPAGSGKSTLAYKLALTLELPYLNTGLMYRALTRSALERGVAIEDGPALAELARSLSFDLDPNATPPSLRVDGRAAPAELRSPEVESRVSEVSAHPEVREVLRSAQRRLSRGGAVVEGRDIGTVVAPDASVKIFLGAEETERVARRARELGSEREAVGPALATRDARDAGTNPLEAAPDALTIDSTRLGAEEVYREALAAIRRALGTRA